LAAILSVAMMLDHMDLARAAERIRAAVRQVLLRPSPRTPDLGGDASTAAVGRAVREVL
jgi:isocitrate/isopropylmalate dehydrogenase